MNSFPIIATADTLDHEAGEVFYVCFECGEEYTTETAGDLCCSEQDNDTQIQA